MTEDELKAIEARTNAATPGPWRRVVWSGIDDGAAWIGTSDGMLSQGYDGEFLDRSDSEFIAAARQDVPALIAEVRRLRNGLAECARRSGADVSLGPPTLPDIVDWAVDCVQELRSDYQEAIEQLPD